MTDRPHAVSVETLLAQRPWVEALARSLVLDEATADDVVQEAWLAAIKNPPREPEALRGWLSRVVRNAASTRRLRARRRALHEAVVVPRDADSSPEETVARVEAHRKVVEAVMKLEEPYRTAVILRYFEGLESDEVARRTGVPVETARTRVKRALEQLRVRLDRDHGGDGRAWALALLPLSPRGRGALVGLATGGAAAVATTLVAAALGTTLGAAATYAAMRPDRGDVESASAGRSASSMSADGGDESSTGAGEARVADTDAVASQAGARAGSPRSALAAAIDQIEAPPQTRPTGTISGHVLTTDGTPVEGAVVRAPGSNPNAPSPVFRRRIDTQQPSLEEQVRAAVIDLKRRAPSTRTTKTDASGAYLLTEVFVRASDDWDDSKEADGEGVTVQASGYDVRVVSDVAPSDGRAAAIVDFVATPMMDVTLNVLQPDGTPSANALVRWTVPGGDAGGRRGSETTWTPQNPTVHLQVGAWVFTAYARPDLRSDAVATRLTSGETPEPVVLQLGKRASIGGIVRLEEPGVDVRLLRIRADLRGAGSDDKPVYAGPRRNRDGNVEYKLTDLTPGDYDVTVALDRTPVLTLSVHAPGGPVAQDIVVPAFNPSQALRVLVSGPDRRWLGNDEVHVRLVQNGGQSADAPVECPTPGTFLVMLPKNASSAGAGATWRVEADSRPYGRKSQDVVPGTTANVAIQFDEPAVLQASLFGAGGSLIADRVLVTLAGRDDRAAPAGVVPFPNGLPRRSTANPISLTVQPGRYVAVLWLEPAPVAASTASPPSDGTHGVPQAGMPIGFARVIAEIPVELRSGVTSLTIPVPELRTATVHVPGVPRNTTVALLSSRQPSREVMSVSGAVKDDGTATFDDLPPGSYAALVYGKGEMLVDLPSSGVVEFSPSTISGLSITVEVESGALANAGLRTGDVIVSVDGTPVETLSGGTGRLKWAAQSREHVQIEVMRGGRRETLTVDPRGFGSRDLLGGWWEPAK